MFIKKSKCVISGSICPRNADPERGDYCPHWAQFSAMDERGNSKVLEECDIITRRHYEHQIQQAARLSAQMINTMHNNEIKASNAIEKIQAEAHLALPNARRN